jgi:hypothetical protein
VTLITIAGVACCAAPAPAAAKAPVVKHLVAFNDGTVKEKRVRASAVSVKVGGRRCAVGRATPLAALVRAKPGALGLKDFGSCSRRAADGGQLFVRSIRGVRNSGQDGWVYKVGRRWASAGAADPSGPFGRGRLRSGQRVTWFYGRMRGGSFQRTLELTAKQSGTGTVVLRVRGYDDDGRGVPVEGADVISRAGSAVTGARGEAVLNVPPGSYVLRARKRGLVPSFGVRVMVR